MHEPPRVRGGLPARLTSLVLGLFLFAVGIVCQLESRLGLSPWDTLHQGIAKHTPISFGLANICVSVVVVTVAWFLGARIGIGTLGNALLVGGFIEALTAIGPTDRLSDSSLGVRIALLAITMPLIGAGSALYLGAWLGAGPRDSLMVVGGQKSGQRLGVVRAALELAVLGAGFALGGTVGVGTVVFALGVGPALEAGFWLVKRSPVGAPAPRPVTPAPAPLAGS
ncbi:MAG TPA: hypothetical protein VJT84_13310 [Gaiellaceae bacterium]|nr:hypothetical protein [Gaiellaceae bacterium]